MENGSLSFISSLSGGGSRIEEENVQDFPLNLQGAKTNWKDDVVMPKDVLYVAENMLGIDPKVEPRTMDSSGYFEYTFAP